MVVASALALVPAPPRARPMVRLHGFFDDLMDKLDGGEESGADWKDQMMAEQTEILRRRQASGGFITEADEEEIRQRRASVDAEEEAVKAVQQGAGGDVLGAWKAARDAGKIRTASSGLERDPTSARLGSSGLLAERADARLPYIDRGYVADAAPRAKKNPFDFLGGAEEKAPPPATTADGIPIKAPAAAAKAATAASPNPFAALFGEPAPPPPPPPPEAAAPAPPSNPFEAMFAKRPAAPPAPEPAPEPAAPAFANPFAALFDKEE